MCAVGVGRAGKRREDHGRVGDAGVSIGLRVVGLAQHDAHAKVVQTLGFGKLGADDDVGVPELAVRERTGCTIVAVRDRSGGPLQTSPAATKVLSDGDELVLAGDAKARERFGELAG